MSRSERYAPCMSLSVVHGYYSGTPPVSIVPDEKTGISFRRSGLVFRPQGKGRWIVLRPEGLDEDLFPTFKVIPTDSLFYYVTERAETLGSMLEMVGQNGVWGVLRAQLKRNEVVETTLRLYPLEKRLEFVLIPRYTDVSAVVELREAQNGVIFLPPEKTLFPGVDSARRIMTREKLPLAESTPYRFQLWEIRDSGERLLADRVPLPEPYESSVVEPRDAVTRYFYY